MEGDGVRFPTLWFRHILGGFWVLVLYEERVFYYNFYYYLQDGNYYCWDNGKVQFIQYDSWKFLEIFTLGKYVDCFELLEEQRQLLYR